jgi:hypothetical protein
MSAEIEVSLSLDQRVAQLERKLRVHRQIFLLSFVAVTLVVALGFAQAPNSIRAPAFEVVDVDGRTRAAFGLSDTGQPGLWFFNIQGAPNGAVHLLGTDGTRILFPSTGGGTTGFKLDAAMQREAVLQRRP